MKRRRFLQALAQTAAALVAPNIARAQSKRFEGITLRCNGFGGDFDRILKEKVAHPLEEKTGLRVVYTPGMAAASVAALVASPNNPPFDMIMCDSPNMPDLIKAGVITHANLEAEVTAKIIPNIRQFGDYGVPMCVTTFILTYSKKAVRSPMQSFADLARPDLAEHVGLITPEASGGNLFLLALAESNGGNIDNIDPAFAYLRKIKPNVTTTTAATVTMLQLLQQEEVWAAPFYDGRVFSMQKAGKPMAFVVPKEGLYGFASYVNSVKGTKYPEAVKAYLEQLVTGDYMTEMARFFGYNPVAKVQLPPDVTAKIMQYGETGLEALRPVDWTKVAANRDEWLNRFNREMG